MNACERRCRPAEKCVESWSLHSAKDSSLRVQSAAFQVLVVVAWEVMPAELLSSFKGGRKGIESKIVKTSWQVARAGFSMKISWSTSTLHVSTTTPNLQSCLVELTWVWC